MQGLMSKMDLPSCRLYYVTDRARQRRPRRLRAAMPLQASLELAQQTTQPPLPPKMCFTLIQGFIDFVRGSYVSGTSASAFFTASANPFRSTSGSGKFEQPRRSSANCLIWEGISGFSSSKSKSLACKPNSRAAWSGGPYASHGLWEWTSAASPSTSSSTSSGDSSFASRSFQYSTTSSWFVHSRTTTHTGSVWRLRSATRKLVGSLGSPSVASTTQAC
mmetsp:Transcript_24810/g.56550  ORF Transcript_24810/g.56550 Transcript_24810/m.56550 type:complete len:219 (+) Transcript_24810:110-766(+)